MIEYNIVQFDLGKLKDQEKNERLSNNKLKCLEICIKILNNYLEKRDYNNLIITLKTLSKKKQQSGFVVMGMVKFTIKMMIPNLVNEFELQEKYFECLRNIFSQFKISINDDLIKSINKRNLDEIQQLILNLEIDPDSDIIIDNRPKKRLSLGGEITQFNTESSTKLDNKLEISIKDISTNRNFRVISPMNLIVSRTESSSNLKMLQGDHFKFTRIKTVKLPHVSMAVDISMSALQIKKFFIQEMNNMKLFVKGDEISNLITAEKKEFQIFKSLLDCFHIGRKNSDPNIVQFSIKYGDNTYDKIIELKSLSGKKEVCESVIINFVKTFIKSVKRMKIIRKSEGLNLDIIIKEHLVNEKNNDKKLYGTSTSFNYEFLNEEDNSLVDNSNKEASNFYEFYRILSQENYDLGKSVSVFVDEFKSKYKNREESMVLIPRQMEETLKFCNECVSTFNCYFNFGKSNTEKMLPYCRPAVEKFIFNKLYFLFYDIYLKKFYEENQKFLIKQNNIKSNLTVSEIMEYLEIKKKFRGNELSENEHILPYKATIDCINKIELEQTPKDKFDTLMKASLELRNCILNLTHGKSELNSMDDELPLFIYITTQINVKNILVELNMIEDYLQYSKSLDKESKVLTNLRSSVFYITHEWKA